MFCTWYWPSYVRRENNRQYNCTESQGVSTALYLVFQDFINRLRCQRAPWFTYKKVGDGVRGCEWGTCQHKQIFQISRYRKPCTWSRSMLVETLRWLERLTLCISGSHKNLKKILKKMTIAAKYIFKSLMPTF